MKKKQKVYKIILCFSFLLLLTGCFCSHHLKPIEPRPNLPQCQVPEKVKVALILGAGGAKGLAHVGVLEEFENAGIQFDLLIGCSAGSLVGSLYADSLDSAQVKKILMPMKSSKFLGINIWTSRFGLSNGHSMRSMLKENLKAKRFEDLQVPFVAVTTDLYSGELVTLGGGDLVPAVQASCAIPFVYAPVKLYGRAFVDGGVVDPVPVRIAKAFNADMVVAVDLRGLLPQTFPRHLFGVIQRSAEITLLWQSEACVKDADVIIRPVLDNVGTFDDDNHKLIYEAGKKAAREAIPLIREKIASL